jgi:Flp pilus assembly protein TadG
MLATRGRRPGPPRRPGRAGNRGDKGALTLTYVIIVPVFLVAVMVIVQTSLWYLARQAALAAARQGPMPRGRRTPS